MKLLGLHSPAILFVGVVVLLGCYAFIIWLIGGFLSFAKPIPDPRSKDLIPKRS